MISMISLASHTYGNRAFVKGDRFEVDPRHVPILVGLGRARTVEHYEDVPAPESVPISDTVDLLATRDMTSGRNGSYNTKRHNKRHGA